MDYLRWYLSMLELEHDAALTSVQSLQSYLSEGWNENVLFFFNCRQQIVLI